MLEKQAIKEKEKIEQQISMLQQEISKLPEGKFLCTHDGPYTKWYKSNGKKPIYIPKENRQEAELLALKKYKTLEMNNLIREKRAIDAYLKTHDPKALEKEQALLNTPEFQELLPIKPFPQDLSEWMYADYPKNPKYKEKLIFKTYAGNYVRSKSEALITALLCKYQIPYRYECQLILGEIEFYPDFTLYNARTRELYYWENFGMMDKPSYSQDVFSKLQTYALYGIVPDINLITTFETKDHPLRMELVEEKIEQFLL